jgi:pyruvate kinase
MLVACIHKYLSCVQMLESMCKAPRPTRAELSDVANAVLDGVDAVMLSGETANGQFPDVAVSTMASIAQNAESAVDHCRRFDYLRSQTPTPMDSAQAVASSAVQMSLDIGSKAILCFTSSGRANVLLSKWRPSIPVFVLTDESNARLCRAQFGLHGIVMNHEGMQVCTSLPQVQSC